MNPSMFKLTKANSFLIFLLSFIAGIGLGNFFNFSHLVLLEEIVLLPIILLWRIKALKVILIAVSLTILGGWHYDSALSKRLIKGNFLYGGNVTIKGTIDEYPEEKNNGVNLIVKNNNDKSDSLRRILVRSSQYSNFQYGDIIEVRGILEKPEKINNFNYPLFLAKEDIQGIISYPQSIEKIGEDEKQWLFFRKNIFKLKREMTEIIRISVNFPESSLLEGMILGEMGMLPDKINNSFRLTGLSHIIVISGLHISLLAVTLRSLRISNSILIILLLCFVILTGSAPSAFRAFLLFLSLVIAKIIGRKGNPVRLLIFIATILLIGNPLLLLHDLSFQLSFLAILSLIYFTSVFKDILEKRLMFIPQEIINHLITAISAQILTWPVISYNFGKISLIAPFANLLVVPLSSALIISGLLISLIGVVFLPIAKILGIICLPFFSYTMAVPKLLALLPGAFTEIKIPAWSLFLYYIVIAFFLYWRRHRHYSRYENNY